MKLNRTQIRSRLARFVFCLAMLSGCPLAEAQIMPEQTTVESTLSTQDQRFLSFMAYTLKQLDLSLVPFKATVEKLRGTDSPAQIVLLVQELDKAQTREDDDDDMSYVTPASNDQYAPAIVALEDLLARFDNLDLPLKETQAALKELPASHPAVQRISSQVKDIQTKKGDYEAAVRKKLYDIHTRANQIELGLQQAETASQRASQTSKSGNKAQEVGEPNNEAPLSDDVLTAQFPIDIAQCQNIRLAYDQRIWFEGDSELVRDLWAHIESTEAWLDSIEQKYKDLIARKKKRNTSTTSLYEETEMAQQSRKLRQAIANFKQASYNFNQRAASELPRLLGEVRQGIQNSQDKRDATLLPSAVRKHDKTRIYLESMLASQPQHPLLPLFTAQFDENAELLVQAAYNLDAALADLTCMPVDGYHGKLQQKHAMEKEIIKAIEDALHGESAINSDMRHEKVLKVYFDSSLWRRAREGYRWQNASQRWLEDNSAYISLNVLFTSGTDRIDIVPLRIHNRLRHREIEWVRTTLDTQMFAHKLSFDEEKLVGQQAIQEERPSLIRATPYKLSSLVKQQPQVETKPIQTEQEIKPFELPRNSGH